MKGNARSGSATWWSRVSKGIVRPLTCAAAAIGMLLAVGGCGSTADAKVMYFWNGLIGDDGPAMQKIINDYNATDPEYKIVFQPMQDKDLMTKIYSVAQTGDSIPDLVIANQFKTAVMHSPGILNTIEDWQKVAPELNEKNYLPQAWNNVMFDGKAYGIPLYMYQMAIYYNKSLVEQYHLEHIIEGGFVTIDEVKSLKGVLPKDIYGMAYGNLPWAFMSLLYGAGGTLETSMDDATSDAWRKPMQALRETVESGVVAPLSVDSMQAFGSGHAVFAQLGTWGQGNMAETLGKDNIAEVNTLQYSTDNFSNFLYQNNWMQIKDPKRPPERSRAAAKFIKYVYEHWMDWAYVGSISPAYRDLNNPEYQKLIQASFTNSQEERDVIRTSNYLYGGYAVTAWNLYNDIVYGNLTLDDGLKALDKTIKGQIEIQDQT
ncbi:ABC transporter substrate-binding protein [Bifidobacterium scardovii]|mgnify:CR=1 FL=1|uniref:ABC transporter substrate-binding protein n=1 Tax=Bifidobacterium scardovii TaxID=158787 RepID=A0A087DK34_9BIFI|nr:extracellular solute-binding protein [Bifidobacterium scardovii]KFI95884.1 ABC transporter substrate-binding protein [Bifidobacterium scardovii]MDK6349471.1 extracellular solute-binding protein [Bifidobacterium scardovii]MDU8981534.1 extracellular solute-binding protein [Bifidobacterium scardovii]